MKSMFAVLVILTAGLSLSAKELKAPAKAEAKGEAKGEAKPNPVQVEMRLLQAAMRDAVTAIAGGDVRALPKRLHAVHLAAGDTKGALEKGTYKLPRNGGKIKAFVALDDDFHREMIKMVKAARVNDVATTAAQFGTLMGRCNGCHSVYRLPPPAR